MHGMNSWDREKKKPGVPGFFSIRHSWPISSIDKKANHCRWLGSVPKAQAQLEALHQVWFGKRTFIGS